MDNTFYYPENLGAPGKLLLWRSNTFFFNLFIGVFAIIIASSIGSLAPFYVVAALFFLTAVVGDKTILEITGIAVRYVARPQKRKWANKTDKMLNIAEVNSSGIIVTADNVPRAYAAWQLTPYNLSVLPAVDIAELIKRFTELLSSCPGIELYCSDLAEDMETNIAYLKRRFAEETEPAVKELIALDIEHMMNIARSQTASRCFVALYALPKNEMEANAARKRIGKALFDAGFGARELDKSEVKKLIAAYFGVSGGNKIPDIDGAQFLL